MLNSHDFKHISAEDAVRVCLLLALDYVFMGQEVRHVIVDEIVTLVDDFYEWDAFPWGEHMWGEFHDRVYNVVSKKRKEYMKGFAEKGSKFQEIHSLLITSNSPNFLVSISPDYAHILCHLYGFTLLFLCISLSGKLLALELRDTVLEIFITVYDSMLLMKKIQRNLFSHITP